MYDNVIGVSESKAIDKKIKDICLGYIKLMYDCAAYEKIREDFIARPHYYLNEHVGMVIPENVKIILDAKRNRWPVVYVKEPNGDKIVFKEGFMGVNIKADLEWGKIQEDFEFAKQGEVDVKIDNALKDCETVVVMPVFDAQSDMLGVYKFSDGAEVVLTSA